MFEQPDCTCRCLYLGASLSTDQRHRDSPVLEDCGPEGRGGLGFLGPEKRRPKGTPAAIIKWSASVWILTTKLLASCSKAWLRPWQEAVRWGLGRKRVQVYMILKDRYQIWDPDQWSGQQSPAALRFYTLPSMLQQGLSLDNDSYDKISSSALLDYTED